MISRRVMSSVAVQFVVGVVHHVLVPFGMLLVEIKSCSVLKSKTRGSGIYFAMGGCSSNFILSPKGLGCMVPFKY